MRLTILGSGTSQGVPTIGCRCEVCRSKDPRDKRLRSSAMFEGEAAGEKYRFIVDAGPDFRQQMLREDVRQIDAILLTHEHKDHIGGLDDVRALNFVDFPTIHRIELYGTQHTFETVRKDYDYAFGENKYRGVPEIDLITLDPSNSFFVKGVEVVPISGQHSSRFSVTGYRIGTMAYLTDFSHIEPAEESKLLGLDALVVNALRFEAHPSHFNVEQALALIERVKPQRAFLTHMSHEIGLYQRTNGSLPDGVELAYDGLKVEI
ncbi:MAG: MBL fold metallo-hydrolase [Rikenellaceae bacterium]